MLVVEKPLNALPVSPDEDFRYGRDEMNLAAFPLALLDDRAGSKKDKEVITRQDVVIDRNTGKEISRRVTVRGVTGLGLPAGEDIAVLVALIKLTWEENQFTSREVSFQRRELLDLLGWPNQGHSYNRLKTALNRWKGVTVEFNGWWDYASQRYVTEIFSLLDNVTLSDERRRRRVAEEKQLSLFSCSFVWNKIVFKSFQDNYLIPLNDEIFFHLPSTAAMNAMRFLNVDLPTNGTAHRYPLEDFCCEKIGMSRSYKPSRMKQELERAVIAPLVASGFLKETPQAKRFVKEGRKFAWVWFARQQPLRQREVYPSLFDDLMEEGEKDTAASVESVVAALCAQGLSRKVADRFAEKHSEEYLLEKIDVLEWMREKQPQKVQANPAGWLFKAIEEDWAAPAGYKPRVEREKAERKKLAERKDAERKEQAERLKQRLESLKRRHIKDHLETLTPDEHQQLEQDALTNVGEGQQSLVDQVKNNGPAKSLSLRLLVEAEILRRHPFNNENAGK